MLFQARPAPAKFRLALGELSFEAFCGAVTATCLAQILLMRFGRDQGIYAMVASTILDGGMPYRDAWDFKPPGIYLVYAAAQWLFGHNEWGIRVLEAAAFASLWPAFRLISRIMFGDTRAGAVAAALSILMQAELEFWHTAQPESFGGVASVWAFALVVNATMVRAASRGNSLWQPVIAGLLFGAATLMKPHFAGGALTALVVGAFFSRRNGRGWGTVILDSATLIGSTALPIAATMAWFVVRGALNDLIQTLFVFAPGYVATTFKLRELPSLLYGAVVGTTFTFSALVPVGLLFALIPHRRNRPSVPSRIAVVSLMMLPQVLGLAMQAKFFPYHHAGLLPFAALLAAPGLVSAWDLARDLGWTARVVTLAALPLLFDVASATRDLPESFLSRSAARIRNLFTGTREEREALAASLYSVADVSYGANVQAARWIAEHTGPSDTVYLWGFEPFVYYAAQRRPATRFIYNVPQRSAWSQEWSRPALIQELETNRPEVIGVLRYDVFPMVTGATLDSRDTLREFPALQHLLEDEYEETVQIEDFQMYVRRADDPPNSPIHEAAVTPSTRADGCAPEFPRDEAP